MTLMMRRILFPALLMLTACMGTPQPSTPAPFTASLNSNSASIARGGNANIVLTTNRAATFEVAGIPAGVTMERGTRNFMLYNVSAADGTAQVTVTVTPEGGGNPVQLPLTVVTTGAPVAVPDPTLSLGATTVTLAAGASATVEFASNGEVTTGTLTGLTVERSGTALILTNTGLSAGTHTLPVTASLGGKTVSSNIAITVPGVPPTALTLSVSPPSLTLAAGEQQAVTVSGNMTATLTATSSHAGLQVTQSESGDVFTVRNVSAPVGQHSVTVSGTGPQGQTANTTVTVTVPQPTPPTIGVNPGNVTLAPGASTTVTVTASTGEFTVTAPAGLMATRNGSELTLQNDGLAPGTYTATLRTSNAGGTATATVTVTVPRPNLILLAAATQVEQGTSGAVAVTVFPQSYRGAASVELRGLPAGVQSSAVSLNFTDAQPHTVELPVTVAAGQALGHYPVTVVATEQGTGLTISQRQVVTVMPRRIALPRADSYSAYFSSITADQTGNLWTLTSGRDGLLRVRPDGTWDTFANPGPNCGDLTLGEDGAVWQTSAPMVRIDAVTGSARVMNEPRGVSGCAGRGMHFDAQSRGWEWYFGIHRVDFARNTYEKVAGSDIGDRLLDVQGHDVWISTTVDGAILLGRIHTDTLTRELISLPGVNRLNTAHAAAGKVWLPDSFPGRLAAFDPATGQVQQFDVRVDGAAVNSFEVLGVDNQGRHWLEIVRRDGELSLREWVLYSPATAEVVGRVPALLGNGGGQMRAIAPDGTLWARIVDPVTEQPYAYVYRP